jgi:hypothetical protein
MIRGRLKLILPTVNTVAAAVLLTVGYARPRREWAPVPWEMALCFTINAPANLLRYFLSIFWDRYIFAHCSEANARACWLIGNVTEIGFFLVVAFVMWHVVVLEIGSIGQGKRAIVPSAPAPRIVVDVALLAAAGFLIFLLVMNWKTRQGSFSPLPAALGMSCYSAWAVAMAVLYGYDLIKCVTRKR